jgi:hypothetical protein
MFRKTILTLAALGAATAASAQQAGPTPGPHSGERASIPFITRSDVRTFTATDNGEGVFIQNARRDWYYVSFFARCTELPWATAIGFTTFGGGPSLDRGDTILAGRERCTIADIVHSGPPPARAKKARKAKAA